MMTVLLLDDPPNCYIEDAREAEEAYDAWAGLLKQLKALLVSDDVLALVQARWNLAPYEADIFGQAQEVEYEIETWLQDYNRWYAKKKS